MATSRAQKLRKVHKAFLVQRLACFDTPKEAAEALKQEFGVEISPQGAQHYDPTKLSGKTLAKPLVEMFETQREAFLKHIEAHIPGANRAVRLARLERAAVYFESKRNYIAMADMTERQAKEMGNMHTNRREHTGKDGGAIKMQEVREMTDEELDREILSLLKQAQAASKRPGSDKER